jgi:hypothetical protein
VYLRIKAVTTLPTVVDVRMLMLLMSPGIPDSLRFCLLLLPGVPAHQGGDGAG